MPETLTTKTAEAGKWQTHIRLRIEESRTGPEDAQTMRRSRRRNSDEVSTGVRAEAAENTAGPAAADRLAESDVVGIAKSSCRATRPSQSTARRRSKPRDIRHNSRTGWHGKKPHGCCRHCQNALLDHHGFRLPVRGPCGNRQRGVRPADHSCWSCSVRKTRRDSGIQARDAAAEVAAAEEEERKTHEKPSWERRAPAGLWI